MTIEAIYGRTGLCPYTGDCPSFKTIVSGERWIGQALSKVRRAGAMGLTEEEDEYSEESLVDKLEQLKRVKDRCYSHNGRCLRFWQFERKNGGKASFNRVARPTDLVDSPEEPPEQRLPENKE